MIFIILLNSDRARPGCVKIPPSETCRPQFRDWWHRQRDKTTLGFCFRHSLQVLYPLLVKEVMCLLQRSNAGLFLERAMASMEWLEEGSEQKSPPPPALRWCLLSLRGRPVLPHMLGTWLNIGPTAKHTHRYTHHHGSTLPPLKTNVRVFCYLF